MFKIVATGPLDVIF